MKVQELKDQVDELAKQNKTVLDELGQLKQLLQQKQESSAQANGQQFPSSSGQPQSSANTQDSPAANFQAAQNPDHPSQNNGSNQQMGNAQGSSNNGPGNNNGGTMATSSSSGNGQPDNVEGGQGGQQGSANPGGSQPVPQLANELVKIKDMITTLESKTANFVTSRSSGKLNQDDIVNLILILMDGMIDWASDFIQKSSAQSADSASSGGSGGGANSQNIQ